MPDTLDDLLRLIVERIYGQTQSEEEYFSLVKAKLPEISRSVADLSNLYTRERGRLQGCVLRSPELRRAYLTYFLPSNFIKIQSVLKEIWMHPQIGDFLPREIRILDVGCGPGTHLLGSIDFLLSMNKRPFETIECAAVDALQSNLADARYFLDRWVDRCKVAAHPASRDTAAMPRVCLETYQADITGPLKLSHSRQFDFIIVGNVLNELFSGEAGRVDKRFRLLSRLIDTWLSPHGFLILIEPALRETSRDLLLLRDQFLDSLRLTVYSPCVHGAHCPAVAPGHPSDWCHESIPWQSPWLIQAIDQRIGNQKSFLKYSYVVLSRTGLSIKDAALSLAQDPDSSQTQLWRVVSETLEERGKASVYLCGLEGRARVTRLNKHSSETNEHFALLDRGQVVKTGALKVKSSNDWRVENETLVQILTGRRL